MSKRLFGGSAQVREGKEKEESIISTSSEADPAQEQLLKDIGLSHKLDAPTPI